MTTTTLQKEFAIGFNGPDGTFIKEYTLLKSNGIAEKVFTDKLQQKPYTWMANVIAIGAGYIGKFPVAVDTREEYARSENVVIPPIVLQIPLAEANSMLVEIHRSVWKNLIRDQESICKYCGYTFHCDIDLNRMTYSEEEKAKINEEGRDWTELIAVLPSGFVFGGLKTMGNQQVTYEEYKDVNFNEFYFRPPTLGDAIKHEKIHHDSIMFWRKIAFDCLTKMYSTDSSSELPIKVKDIYGMKLFNELLDRGDLSAIRVLLRDGMPTLPFFYQEECPTCRKETEVAVEPTSFFTD